jgi:hypothetical protein
MTPVLIIGMCLPCFVSHCGLLGCVSVDGSNLAAVVLFKVVDSPKVIVWMV